MSLNYRLDRSTRRYIDRKLSGLPSGQLTTDATHRLVTDDQIAAWTAGSGIRHKVIAVNNLAGTSFQRHGLGTTDVWGAAKRSDGQLDSGIVVKADPTNATVDTAQNCVKVIVPDGEVFTGSILVSTYN